MNLVRRSYIFLYGYAVILFFGFSCGKPVPADFVILGDTEGMQITALDTVIQPGNISDPDYLDIDVNNDGIDDLRCWSSTHYTPPHAILISHHENISIHSTPYTDTVFHHTDIVGNNVIHYENCFRMAPEDSTFGVNQGLQATAFDAGQSIYRDDNWHYTDTLLLTTSLQLVDYKDVFNGNEYIHYFWIEDNSCHNFPVAEDKYIAFKIKSGNEEKMGWLRLVLAEKVKFLLIRFAIQE